MKKVLIIAIGLFASINLYAKDVSKFDIKGIKLGMSKSDVLKRMPCSHPKIKKDYYYGSSKGNVIECSDDNELIVFTDNSNKVWSITYKINFQIEPNWKTIEKKIFKKYGKTNLVNDTSDSRYYDQKSYCWGTCRTSNGVFNQVNHKSSLTIVWTHDFSENRNSMFMALVDGRRQLAFKRWVDNDIYLKNQKAKQKASNIDF